MSVPRYAIDPILSKVFAGIQSRASVKLQGCCLGTKVLAHTSTFLTYQFKGIGEIYHWKSKKSISSVRSKKTR